MEESLGNICFIVWVWGQDSFFLYVSKPSDLAQVIEKTIFSSLLCSINTLINQSINQVFIYMCGSVSELFSTTVQIVYS